MVEPAIEKVPVLSKNAVRLKTSKRSFQLGQSLKIKTAYWLVLQNNPIQGWIQYKYIELNDFNCDLSRLELSLVLICRRPPTRTGTTLRHTWIYRQHNLSQALTCEVELTQASRRLSTMKIFYVNIICGDLRRYAATKSQVGRRHMRTRLYADRVR